MNTLPPLVEHARSIAKSAGPAHYMSLCVFIETLADEIERLERLNAELIAALPAHQERTEPTSVRQELFEANAALGSLIERLEHLAFNANGRMRKHVEEGDWPVMFSAEITRFTGYRERIALALRLAEHDARWIPQAAPARAAEWYQIPASDFGLEPEMQPVVDELRRRMNAAGATDSSHIAAAITRLMPFVQHTDACVGARSRSACECGAARAMEDAKNIATALSTADPEVAHPAHQDESETVANLRERMRWYRDGCPDLEDTPVYFVSGDCARDAAGDLETALGEIERLTKGAPARAAEWQPIETAPKDGPVLVTNGSYRWIAHHPWMTRARGGATHWAPLLPLPPCALTGQEEAS